MKKLLGITIFLILVYGGLLFSDKNATSFRSQFNLGKEIGLYGILSLAAGLLIVTGGIDLSLGSLVCLSSTVFGLLVVNRGVSVPVAFLAMLGVGAVAGLTNGLLVTKLRLQPFMVTLCGLFIMRSLARWLAGDASIGNLGSALRDVTPIFGSDKLFLSVYLIIFLSLAVVAAVFLHLSVFGRYFLAVGSNERAARFAGVKVDLYKILAYVICSVLTALYSFLALMNTPSVMPSTTGQNVELIAIAAAVLGGCSLRGGEGTVYGMVVGAMIIQILIKLRSFMKDIPDAAEGMMIGIILLAGIIIDELLRRRDVNRQHGT